MGKNKPTYWELFAAKHHGELTNDELVEFEKYQREHPEEWKSSIQIKEGLDALSEVSTPDQTKNWRSIQRQIQTSKIRRIAFSSFKYAAVVAVSLLVGYLIQNQYKQTAESQYAEVEVMYGQMGHLFLFDGTEVWLDSGSRLKYPNQFNQGEREVILEGEGFFKVAKNKHLPFKVKTQRLEVEVLGTSFNVSSYDDSGKISVVLEEGSVRLNWPGGEEITTIKPGEMAELDSAADKLAIRKVDTKYYTDWKDGTLEFRDEPLGNIAKKLERWYNVQISIEDPAVADYKISGTVLRNKPVQQIIQALEFLAPVRTEYLSKSNQKDLIKIAKK